MFELNTTNTCVMITQGYAYINKIKKALNKVTPKLKAWRGYVPKMFLNPPKKKLSIKFGNVRVSFQYVPNCTHSQIYTKRCSVKKNKKIRFSPFLLLIMMIIYLLPSGFFTYFLLPKLQYTFPIFCYVNVPSPNF